MSYVSTVKKCTVRKYPTVFKKYIVLKKNRINVFCLTLSWNWMIRDILAYLRGVSMKVFSSEHNLSLLTFGWYLGGPIFESLSYSSVSIWQQTGLLHKILFWTVFKSITFYVKPFDVQHPLQAWELKIDIQTETKYCYVIGNKRILLNPIPPTKMKKSSKRFHE